MVHELNHVGVRIRDLDASLEFYTGVLGARVADVAYIPSTKTDCVHIQLAGGLIELLRPAEPRPGTTFGLDHLGFITDDLDGDFERLTDAGCEFFGEPRVAGSGRGRLVFLPDPNDVRVELIQRTEEFRGPQVPGFVTRLDHIAVAAPDLPAAADFYANRLGMTPALPTSPVDESVVRCSFGADTVELRRIREDGRRGILELGLLVAGGLEPGDAEPRELIDPDGVRFTLRR